MIVDSILKTINGVIDRVWPSPQDKQKAEELKAKVQELAQSGELQYLAAASQNIQTEAKSEDEWVARARPTFLYVMYIMILLCIPMGVLHTFEPAIAEAIAEGMKEWLEAIPEALWALFGAGYLGYTVSRSYDKAHK